MAANVRRLRDARQLTTGGLAERVSARGVPMNPTTVTKIEKLSRRVTVDELAALAEVLDVATAALMIPADADPVAAVAEFANHMLRPPFRLEINAGRKGVTDWSYAGGGSVYETVPRLLTAALADAAGTPR